MKMGYKVYFCQRFVFSMLAPTERDVYDLLFTHYMIEDVLCMSVVKIDKISWY